MTRTHTRLCAKLSGRAMSLLLATFWLPVQGQSKPAVPIASLRTMPPFSKELPTIRGTVTRLGDPLYLQDHSGGIEVISSGTHSSLRIGDEVEIIGQPVAGRYTSRILPSSIRFLGSRSPNPPLAVSASQAASGDYDRLLIETEGILLSTRDTAEGVTLLLRGGQQTYVAELPLGNADAIKKLRTGSWVRTRGICVMSDENMHPPVSFHVLLRSAGDVLMLSPPPFWTLRHVLLLVALLVLLSAGALLLLNRFRQWQFSLILDERTRMAHDLHDTLAQNFAGVAFQLQAIRSALRKRRSEPEISRHIDVAMGMVSHSHEDARRAIAMLKPSDYVGGSLLQNLEEQAANLTHGGNVRLAVEVTGDPVELPGPIEQTLLRIGHEAISNAIRHGEPSSITMQLNFLRNEVHFTIRDDGRGFTSPLVRSRGLGLAGMRSRASAHGGSFRIHSSVGQGCSVEVHLPVVCRSGLLGHYRAGRAANALQ